MGALASMGAASGGLSGMTQRVGHLPPLSPMAGTSQASSPAMADSVVFARPQDGDVPTVGVSGVPGVPESKTDLAIGTHDIPCPAEETTVA